LYSFIFFAGHCVWKRKCHIKHIAEERIEEMGRQGRRCKQILDDLKEERR
jgi:hypothetical protein